MTNMDTTLASIATMNEQEADAFEKGATTIIRLMDEAAEELLRKCIISALVQGGSEEDARHSFGVVMGGLLDIAQPNILTVRDAVRKQQPNRVDPIQSLIAGLLASLIGEEEAAEFLTTINDEDEDEEEYEVESTAYYYEDDEDDEPMADWERELLAEDDEDEDETVEFVQLVGNIDEFIATLFGVKSPASASA